MSGARGGCKDVRRLQRLLRPGYALRANGSAKFVVVGPAGEVVRRADGRPLGLPNSPGRWAGRGLERRLAEAGVLAAGRRA